jgi:hypothetical protein
MIIKERIGHKGKNKETREPNVSKEDTAQASLQQFELKVEIDLTCGSIQTYAVKGGLASI